MLEEPPEMHAVPHEKSAIERLLDKDKAVDVVFDHPEVRSYTSVVFDMPEADGRALAPEHRLAFVVPEKFQGRLVRDVILRHRKGEKGRELIGADRHDPHGAYSRVEVHNTTDNAWHEWSDPKGYSADKFAEPRPAGDPEHEVLHDWIATVGAIKADALRVTNVGDHPEYSTARVHGVEIVFFPELQGVAYAERIYCEGTQFIDLEKQRLLPTYGGGSHTEGKYVGAIALNGHGRALYDLGTDPGPDARKESSRLIIALDSSKTLAQVEVAVGDTEHLATVSAKTGRSTRLGYAKLWVGVKRAKTGAVEWFVENANIPPQGVIAGGPHLERAAIEQGDELVIEARADTAYVMGWRLAYKEKEKGT